MCSYGLLLRALLLISGNMSLDGNTSCEDGLDDCAICDWSSNLTEPSFWLFMANVYSRFGERASEVSTLDQGVWEGGRLA